MSKRTEEVEEVLQAARERVEKWHGSRHSNVPAQECNSRLCRAIAALDRLEDTDGRE